MRRRGSRNRRRKIKLGNNILIITIIILIIINIGTIFFRLNNKPVFNPLKYVKNIISLPSFGILNKKSDNDNIIKPLEPNSNTDMEDEEESNIYKDYIIIDKLDEYESLIIIKDSHGTNSIENIPSPLNIQKVQLNKDKNYILMYHTHGTESFLTDNEDEYNNEDKNKNVVAIGKTMATVLEANGHKVDHVETLHDLPSYNNSYSRSLNTINNKKEEEKNLKIFLDIHRDGVAKDAPYRESFLKTARINIGGTSVATFSLVIGPATPNYDQVLSFAKYIKAVSDTLYPGLCKGIIIKPYGKFNLYASDYSALIEMGSNLITLEEANEGAKLVGEILSLVLDSIIE